MIHEPPVLISPALLDDLKPSVQLASVRHHIGLQHLHKAFRETRPLTVLTGRSSTDASRLISRFLSSIKGDVTVVRIDKTCAEALDGMREVIRATGFDPHDMKRIDLENIFTKFLSIQRVKNHHTIFLIEESPVNESWVRDYVRDLVDLEAAGKYGLMVILFRQTGLHNSVDEPNLDRDMSATTINPAQTERSLFPSAPLVRAPDAEIGSGPIELFLDTDSNGNIPLKKDLTPDGQPMLELSAEQPRLMIGRAKDNDLCINGRNVSRHHAILVQYGAAAVVMDLNSANGTYVNSCRIKDQVVVHHDIIAIGDHRIRFIAANIQ